MVAPPLPPPQLTEAKVSGMSKMRKRKCERRPRAEKQIRRNDPDQRNGNLPSLVRAAELNSAAAGEVVEIEKVVVSTGVPLSWIGEAEQLAPYIVLGVVHVNVIVPVRPPYGSTKIVPVPVWPALIVGYWAEASAKKSCTESATGLDVLEA
jgi:hypothetical protein